VQQWQVKFRDAFRSSARIDLAAIDQQIWLFFIKTKAERLFGTSARPPEIDDHCAIGILNIFFGSLSGR
jgi:hypothetical protein